MDLKTYILKKCLGCNGHGRVNVEDEQGRDLGQRACPRCLKSPKPGYILLKKVFNNDSQQGQPA